MKTNQTTYYSKIFTRNLIIFILFNVNIFLDRNYPRSVVLKAMITNHCNKLWFAIRLSKLQVNLIYVLDN